MLERPKDDVVIDIETCGTKQDSIIVSIGAVIFNRADAPGTIIDKIEFKLDIVNQKNRVAYPDTMLWWMKDSMREARMKTFFSADPKLRLGLALKNLDDFIKKYDLGECWGCGPDFDMRILEHAYDQHGRPFPMPFWTWRCIRTIESFFYGKNTRKDGGENWVGGTAHDAVDDCIMEAKVIQNCYSVLQKVAKLQESFKKVST